MNRDRTRNHRRRPSRNRRERTQDRNRDPRLREADAYRECDSGTPPAALRIVVRAPPAAAAAATRSAHPVVRDPPAGDADDDEQPSPCAVDVDAFAEPESGDVASFVPWDARVRA